VFLDHPSRQVTLDLDRAHVARMALAAGQGETPDRVEAGFLGPQRQAEPTDPPANLIKQPRRRFACRRRV
jgi:hypothetical protein